MEEGLQLQWTHFVLWDGKLSKGATVSWRVIGSGRHGAAYRDAGCDGRHFPCVTLGSNSRSFCGLIHVAFWDGSHAGKMLDQAFPELQQKQINIIFSFKRTV